MQALTHEWVEKVDGDFLTAQREYRARKTPNYDAVCFHSQQCVEKYLKALLQENNIAFGKTHDLAVIMRLLTIAMSILLGLSAYVSLWLNHNYPPCSTSYA